MNEELELLTCAAVWTLSCAGLFFVSYAIAAVIQAFRGRAAALHECRKLHDDLKEARAEMHAWRSRAYKAESAFQDYKTSSGWAGECIEDEYLEYIDELREKIDELKTKNRELKVQIRTYDAQLQRKKKRGEKHGKVEKEVLDRVRLDTAETAYEKEACESSVGR